MAPEDGALWLAGRQVGHPEREEFVRRTVRARNVVEARTLGVDQSDIFRPVPTSINEYVSKLEQNPPSAPLFKEGFRVALVDLERVCAIQPHVLTESAVERLQGVDVSSLESVASVTLPIPGPERMPAQFDSSKNAWIFSSRNPNLRIAGNFSGEVQPGVPGFGFVVSISNSYVQVAGLRGRYFLRDGYHRSFGLLAAGARWVPCLVREFRSFEELALPAGLLPQDAFLGERPALLTDYFHEDVSAAIEVGATNRMIVIQGLEFSTLS